MKLHASSAAAEGSKVVPTGRPRVLAAACSCSAALLEWVGSVGWKDSPDFESGHAGVGRDRVGRLPYRGSWDRVCGFGCGEVAEGPL